MVDNGATHHFFGYKEVLSNLVEREANLKIIHGDNSSHPIIGFGYVKFHLNSGESIFLHDFMYMIGLKKNLVLISALEEKWMRIFFIKLKVRTWPIISPMIDAFTLGSIFEGLCRVTKRPLLSLVDDTNHLSDLWHQRLAHVHYDALSKLEKLVSGITKVQSHHDGVFPGCSSGKKKRVPFLSNENNTNDILHLIHSGICGLMPMHFVDAHLYYITFSINTWIYYLNNKDEYSEMFKEFKILIKNQIGNKIKIFESDNGGEYTSKEFIDFCKKEGIKKETIMPYNPKQNGVVERKNMSL